jgi:hypothetical protein
MRRRFVSSPGQLAGLALLALLPIIALTGRLGDSTARERAVLGELLLDLSYPSTMRYGNIGAVELHLHNAGERVLARISVEADTSYVTRFSRLRAVPPVERQHAIPVPPLEPGASGVVALELEAHRYGRHRGELRLIAGADTVLLRLSTFVFP